MLSANATTANEATVHSIVRPISIAGSDNVFPGYDGQWRMAAFSTISRGADMVAYWHWHSLHYGHEIYSHGIVNHDLEPNRNYDEVAGIGRDLAKHGDCGVIDDRVHFSECHDRKMM